MRIIVLTALVLLTSLKAFADNPPETIYDEGTRRGVAYRLNCVGAGIACTQSGITGTITVGGGASATAAGGLGAVQYGSPAGTFAGDETKVSINSNGNVGIGTSDGKALFNVNSSANQDLFRVDDSAGSDATPFIIDQTGNVGIGTATPLAVVAISSTLNQALFRVDDNGNGDLSPFIIDASGNVGIGTTNTERDGLLVMNGNVGIGTWVPSTKLDVAGTIVTTSGGDIISAGNIGIGTNLTSKSGLSVMSGNVGIGTWIPNQSFVVNGNIGIGTIANGAALSINNGAFSISSSGTITNVAGTYNGHTLLASGTSNPIIFSNSVNSGSSVSSLVQATDTNTTTTAGGFAVGVNASGVISGNSANPFTIGVAGRASKSGATGATTFGSIRGITGTGEYTSTGTQLDVIGVYGVAQKITSASGAITDAYSIFGDAPIASGGGTITRAWAGAFNGNAIFTGNVGIGTVLTTNPPGGALYVNGNVGIGTYLPSGKLNLNGNGGSFISQQTTAPTVANNDCGSTGQGTVVAKSTDLSGTVTVGTLAVTSCAVTFNGTFNGAPNCICMDDSNVLAVRCTATATKLTITSATSMSSDLVTWFCPGNS